jgi:osmotically-inducible protein OsmY
MKTIGLIPCVALVLAACATPQQSPDAQLAQRIKQEIAQTEGIGGARSVNVETARGVVILSGYIGSEKQRNDAAQTALKVSGVQQVFNNIQVLNTSSGE